MKTEGINTFKREKRIFFSKSIPYLVAFLLFLTGFINDGYEKACKASYQIEVKKNLAEIHSFQEAYFHIHGEYAKTFKELGWRPYGNYKYYYIMGNSHIHTLTQYNYIRPGEKQYESKLEIYIQAIEYIIKSFFERDETIVYCHKPVLTYDDISFQCGNGKFATNSYVSDKKYSVLASTNLDYDRYVDGWQIDQKGEIKNVCDDVNDWNLF